MAEQITRSARELKLLEYLAQTAGADLYNYGDAVDGRSLQKMGLIDVVPAQKAPKSGAARQPYFGAKISDAGRDWLAASGLLQRGVAA